VSLFAPPADGSAHEPSLSADRAALSDAVSCPPAFTRLRRHDPVLLVHGTAVTPEEHWGWNYVPALRELGYDVCTVWLPDRALGDIQLSSEYVVHAIRFMSKRAKDRKIDVIGHSQGALQPRWALKYWPTVRRVVDDYVSLAGPNHGIVTADAGCAGGSCVPAWWQYKTGSKFLAALNATDETPGNVSYTSIYSQNDELIQPYTTAPLQGAANMMIQDLCSARPVEHVGEAYDAVVFAAVIDAISRRGPAKPARFATAELCTRSFMPGVDAVSAASGSVLLYNNAIVAIQNHRRVDREPRLRSYAR
jgi:triacylglycerol esterase/lipase EstA (alpha/beta hydrolase family)